MLSNKKLLIQRCTRASSASKSQQKCGTKSILTMLSYLLVLILDPLLNLYWKVEASSVETFPQIIIFSRRVSVINKDFSSSNLLTVPAKNISSNIIRLLFIPLLYT